MQVDRGGEASNKAEDHKAAESAAGERLQGIWHCDIDSCTAYGATAKQKGLGLGPFGLRVLDTQMASVNPLHASYYLREKTSITAIHARYQSI